jgi:hypothetical protein
MLTIELLSQALALHVGHHVEQESVRLARVEQRQDMRMLEVRGRLDLGQEALRTDHRGQLGLEDLERDFAFVFEIFGQVDRGHPALAQLALDRVAAFQGCVQAGGGVGGV